MPQNIKTYDPTQVSLIVSGSIINSWNQIKVAYDEDANLMSVGTTGEITRTKNANRMGSIAIELPQASSDNLTLNALSLANEVIAVLAKDGSGTTIVTMAEGVFTKRADVTFGKDANDGPREWILKGAIEVVGGGN